MLPVRDVFHGVSVDVFLAHTNFLEGKDCLEWEGPKRQGDGPYLKVPISSDPTAKVARSALHLSAGFFGFVIPKGKRIRMKCLNPLCINPAHIGDTTTVKKRNAARGENNGNSKLTDEQVMLDAMRSEPITVPKPGWCSATSVVMPGR